jgi:hypothetical protein
MAWPDSISVYHKLRSAPQEETESFLLDVIILSERHQRPAARCVEDIVVYDYRKGRKTPLSPFIKEAFGQTLQLQEHTKEKKTARMQSLIHRVEAIEDASWNRSDAKEDLGSAS